MKEEKYKNKIAVELMFVAQLERLVADGIKIETEVIPKTSTIYNSQYKQEPRQGSRYTEVFIAYLKEPLACVVFQTYKIVINMNIKKIKRDIRSIAKPSISKKEYEDRVEDLADHVLNDFPEDTPIEDRIWEAADSSTIVIYPNEMTAPICYSKNEPCDMGTHVKNSGISGLSFAHLQEDIREKVEQKQNNSSSQGGGSDE